jgi:hypothetical protein
VEAGLPESPSSVRYVVGPDGSPLTRGDLPPAGGRWAARQKAIVVIAVKHGLITLEEACARYALSTEEFAEWETSFQRSGLHGLRATCLPRMRCSGANVPQHRREIRSADSDRN